MCIPFIEGSYGKVYVNDHYISDFGISKPLKMRGFDGFDMPHDVLNFGKTNTIDIVLKNEIFLFDGIPDNKFFIGEKKILKDYIESNNFINSFFQYGIIYFSVISILILLILISVEKNDGKSNVRLYFNTIFLLLSALIFNLVYSGSFISFLFDRLLLKRLLNVSAALLCMISLDFLLEYFYNKKNVLSFINKIIAGTFILLYMILPGSVEINTAFSVFIKYFFIIILYMIFVCIKESIFKRQKDYGIIMLFSFVVCAVSGVLDLLNILNIVNTPDLLTVTISNFAIMSTIVVFTDFISISLTNKRLNVELKDLNENLEKKVEARTAELQEARDALWGEMELAKKIQTMLLPAKPGIPGYEISATMLTASQVGGDYYDIINVKSKGITFNWAVIGDVSGHGVPAGLIMMMVQTAIHTVLEENPSVLPSNLLTVINKVITSNIRYLGEDKYMTITVFAVTGEGEFRFSGMHLALLIYRYAKKEIERIDTRGTWIGLLDDITGILKDDMVKLEKSDVLLLYTDGVTEAWKKGTTKDNRPMSDMFGDKNLDEAFLGVAEKPTEEICNGVLKALDGYEFADDVTLMVLKKV